MRLALAVLVATQLELNAFLQFDTAIHFSYVVSYSLLLCIINTLCLVFYNAARGQDLMIQLQHLV